MPTIEEQKETIRKMLASAPEAWISVGAFMLTHSAFPTVYCATDYNGGFTANDHNGVSRDFMYVPLSYSLPDITQDLAVTVEITVADLNTSGEELGTNKAIAELLDMIPVDSEDTVKITMLVYISYPDGTFSDVAEGPYELEITNVVFAEEGCQLTAKSPDAIFASCGEIYTVERFPMLRQYL